MKNPKPIARNYPAAGNSPSTKIKAPPRHVAGIDNAKVRAYRTRGHPIDGVLGAGPENLPPDFVSRSLARIVRKGIRTGHVLEIGEGSFALSPELPAGTFAFRTADRITLYQSETAEMIVTVPCAAIGNSLAAASNA